jgi:transposase
MASLQRKFVKGHEYWSLIESKRINGKPTPIVLEYYGNTKKFAEKLLNGEYNEKVLKSYSHGDTTALSRIVKKLGIVDILDDVFKIRIRSNIKRSTSLIIIALQRACDPGSKNELADWFRTTTLGIEMGINAETLTSQHFWEQMDDISEEELNEAEDAIVKKIFDLYNFELEKLALDYTNYFSFIDTENNRNKIAQRGKNKQKRNDLRQYSLAVVTTKETELPLYSHVYEGNVNDQTEFFQYVNSLKERIPNFDPTSITLVFDGGSNNKKNFAMLETHYICSFSLSSCKELYDISIKDYSELEINGSCVKNFRLTKEIWGIQRECILTYSSDLARGQLRDLDKVIQSTIDDIEELNQKLSNPKSRISRSKESIEAKIKSILNNAYAKEILRVELIGDPIVSAICFFVDGNAKSNIVEKYFGKKLIISDRNDWSTYEIIKTYREQDCIEKIFKTTKDPDHLSIRPQYHYTDQKIRVHIFCCLLGFMLATVLQKEISNAGICISKNKILDNLKNIRQCYIKDKVGIKVSKTLEEMDDMQNKLWLIVGRL